MGKDYNGIKIVTGNDRLLEEAIKKKNKKLDRVAKLLAFRYRNLLRKTLREGRTTATIYRIALSPKYTGREIKYLMRALGDILVSNPKNKGWTYEHSFGTHVSFYYGEET